MVHDHPESPESPRTGAILASFARTTDEIFSLSELRTKLNSGRPLRIKYGVDVTAPMLHIGHAVNLWMMRELQDHGHKVVFLIGDFTTRVGDPTGKSKTRPVLPREEIEANAQHFIDQVSSILRTEPEVFEVRRNSEWFDSMGVDRFMSLLSMTTHSKLISRDMFRRRIDEGSEIHTHELLYPILQGYDSYELQSDLTIVGTDQLFNEMMGRFYQERLGQEPQVVITTKITPGIDGREKQSKSLGNYISIAHEPREMFGRTMRIPDHLIGDYLRVYTAVPLEEITATEQRMADRDLNPMEAKRRLARELVTRYYDEPTAHREDEWFQSTFSDRKTPEPQAEIHVPKGSTLLTALAAALPDQSKSALRRLARGGGVSLDGTKLLDPETVLDQGGTLRAGKRDWFTLTLD